MDPGAIQDSLSWNTTGPNGSRAFPSPAHISSAPFLEIFFIEVMSRVAQKFPLKIFLVASLAFHTNKTSTKWLRCKVCDCLVRHFRLIMLSLQSV